MKSNSIFQPLRNIVLFLIISCVLVIGLFGFVGCGNKDNIDSTPKPAPEEPTTPEEPPIIEKEYIKVYFGPPIKNFTVTRGYFDGENGLYFNQSTNKWIIYSLNICCRYRLLARLVIVKRGYKYQA